MPSIIGAISGYLYSGLFKIWKIVTFFVIQMLSDDAYCLKYVIYLL